MEGRINHINAFNEHATEILQWKMLQSITTEDRSKVHDSSQADAKKQIKSVQPFMLISDEGI